MRRRESDPTADVGARVHAFVTSELLLDPKVKIDGHTPLRGLIDSIGAMELLSFIEDEFDIVVQHSDIDEENLGSIDRIARFVVAERSRG
jgi:acyl carrier protein